MHSDIIKRPSPLPKDRSSEKTKATNPETKVVERRPEPISDIATKPKDQPAQKSGETSKVDQKNINNTATDLVSGKTKKSGGTTLAIVVAIFVCFALIGLVIYAQMGRNS